MGRLAQRTALSGGLLFVVMLGVLVARTATLDSRQVEVEPAPIAEIPQAAVERLRAALRVPTVSSGTDQVDGEALLALHTLLEESFPRVHAALEREIVNQYSLLYRWPGREAATGENAAPIVLTAHLDVVPVSDEDAAKWTHPPFDAVLADGFVWGRGALDDKVDVMALLEAVEFLLARDFTPPRTVYLAFGHDEEIGGREGAVHLAARLAELGVRPAFVRDEGMIIAKGQVPGIEPPVALVGIAEKGYVTLELTARSSGGHSSMPPPGGSAVARLARALTRLDAQPLPAHMDGVVGDFLAAAAPEMAFGQRLALSNLWLFGPVVERSFAGGAGTNAMLRTTTALTMLEGSVKDNILPTTARARVNFRVHPADSVASVREMVERIVDDPAITLTEYGFASEPSPVSPIDGEGFRRIERAVREIFPEVVVAPTLVLGATDARHYTELTDQLYRFSPLVLGGEDLARVHGIDERISVENYLDAVRFFVRLIEGS